MIDLKVIPAWFLSALNVKPSLNCIELDHNGSYNFAFKNQRVSYSIKKTEFHKTRFYRNLLKVRFAFPAPPDIPKTKEQNYMRICGQRSSN